MGVGWLLRQKKASMPNPTIDYSEFQSSMLVLARAVLLHGAIVATAAGLASVAALLLGGPVGTALALALFLFTPATSIWLGKSRWASEAIRGLVRAPHAPRPSLFATFVAVVGSAEAALLMLYMDAAVSGPNTVAALTLFAGVFVSWVAFHMAAIMVIPANAPGATEHASTKVPGGLVAMAFVIGLPVGFIILVLAAFSR